MNNSKEAGHPPHVFAAAHIQRRFKQDRTRSHPVNISTFTDIFKAFCMVLCVYCIMTFFRQIMLVKEESVNTRYQQEKRISARPVMPYWAVLGAGRQKEDKESLFSFKRSSIKHIGVMEKMQTKQRVLGSHHLQECRDPLD